MLPRIFILLMLTLVASAQKPAPSTTPKPEQKLSLTSARASGSFEVKITPIAPDNDVSKAANVGRMTIDKRFHGPLEAVSKGEMLAVQGDVKGSAGYVAMERVTGTLNGKRGSFVLQHNAWMDRGKPSLFVTVVPDSGTDELKGINGWMNIVIEGTKHYYEFNYELPAPDKTEKK